MDLGGTAQAELEVKKLVDGSDYTLQFKIGTLNMNNFLAHFRIEASEIISSELSFASSRMSLATLIMQDPEMTGLFSPGGGFEIVATGRITAPELPADASKFYLIIQDFKEGRSDSVDEGYGRPSAAIFATFSKQILPLHFTLHSRCSVYDLHSFPMFSSLVISSFCLFKQNQCIFRLKFYIFIDEIVNSRGKAT